MAKISSLKCNLCNAGRFKLVKALLREGRQKCKVYQCVKCGHIQLLPRPSAEDDKAFYNKNLQDKNRKKIIRYGNLRQNNSFDTNRHVQLIQKFCPDKKNSIADIGAGYGFFVDQLFRQGYKSTLGIEISQERRDLGLRHTKAKIIDFDVNDPAQDIGKFNLITIFHVLEHMADPIEFLKNCRSLLKKGGILVCEVPNVNELLLKTCQAYNDFYWIRAHLNYFSGKSLEKCFRLAGFKSVKIQFAQRYGLDNLVNWLEFGKPQIKKPVFEIAKPYKQMEDDYRDFLTSRGQSDAIIALAKL
jgi:2-polyprenyl-3-methyl-5-hydroxy-6-metoxy-1,4-benzoquinol methylase